MSLADSKTPRAWPASLHLVLFAAIIALPLLALLGAMFYRSAVQEHQRLERLIGQELDELTASIDRDIERRTAVLQTLATAPALASEDWAAFYLQAKASLGKNYLVLIDAAGRQLVNTFVPHGEAPAFTGDPATIESMRADDAAGRFRPVHQPGRQASGLQRLHPDRAATAGSAT